MRRYDDPVEVRRGTDPDDRTGQATGDGTGDRTGDTTGDREGPAQFLWRGRVWKVRSVLAHWVETGPWWTAGEAAPPGADLLAERELWRVEAGRGSGPGAAGVFELSFSWTDGCWQLVGCAD